jgi:Flp pilus assembly pilin Flp
LILAARLESNRLGLSENGQTTIEYALITALVIALAVVSFAVLRSSILTFFANLISKLGALGG